MRHASSLLVLLVPAFATTARALGAGTPPWHLEALLVPAQAQAQSQVGSAVSLSGESFVVGGVDNFGAGGAWVFRYGALGWEQEAQLFSPQPTLNDRFGHAVAIDGDTIAVGSPRDSTVAVQQGSVHVYRRSGSIWSVESTLTLPDPTASDLFGTALVLQGDRLAISAVGHDSAATNGGAVYVFERSGTTWGLAAKLTASDAGPSDQLGLALALDGDTLLAGAPKDDITFEDRGSVYVFVRSGATWIQEHKLTVGDVGMDDELGRTVALEGDRVVAGAPFWANTEEGSAYAWQRDGETWALELPRLQSPQDGTQQWDHFGWSLALQGDELLVGAVRAGALTFGPGAVHAYERSGSSWSYRGRLPVSLPSTAVRFGSSLDLDGDLVVVGATGHEGHFPFTGGVFVFRRDPGGVSFCAGDGSGAACPCGNTGAPGHGCDNAQATGGVRLELVAFDSNGAGGGTALFQGTGFPPAANPTVVVIRSPLSGAGLLGDGLLCLSPPVVRFGASIASGGSSLHAATHGAGSGTFQYQLWCRNTPASFCDPAAGFNASNGLRVTWY